MALVVLDVSPKHVLLAPLLWVFLLFTYRVFLHPLRKYPGPFFAKITDAYAGWHAIGKRPHLNVYQNVQKHGPVYRAGPNRLIFSSLTAIQDIYSHPSITKSISYPSSRPREHPNIITTVDKADHKRKRHAVAQVVSERSLRIFDPTMDAQVNIFLRQLSHSAKEGKAVNMTTVCKRLAVDIVSFMAFGYAINTQTSPTNRLITDNISTAGYMINVFFNWPALGSIGLLFRWLRIRKAKKFYQLVQKMFHTRQAEPKDAKVDFYSVAGKDEKAGEGLYESELSVESIVFVVAGGTTVATAMCGILFYLARHPAAYKRLAAEIRQVFSSGQDIHPGSQLSSCKYLRAVIDESLRMSPPSIVSLWREPQTSYTGPFVVDGHVIPRGTEVGVNIYSILHDSNFYPDPFSFKPERWLSPEDGGSPSSPEQQEARATMRRAHIPFGLGDRSCVGKVMAYREVSLVIARIMWYFDFETAPGPEGTLGEGARQTNGPWDRPDQFQLHDVFVADHDGPNLVFTPRGDHWKELEEKQ